MELQLHHGPHVHGRWQWGTYLSIHLLILIRFFHIYIHNPISHSHFSSPNHASDRHQWPMHCSRILIRIVHGINHLFFISVGFLFLMLVDNGAKYQWFHSVWWFQVCNDHGRLECRSHYLQSDDCICVFQFFFTLIQRCRCCDNGCPELACVAFCIASCISNHCILRQQDIRLSRRDTHSARKPFTKHEHNQGWPMNLKV